MWGKPYGSPHARRGAIAGPDIAPAGARRNRQSRPAFPPPVRRCRRQHEHARQASSGRAKIKARRAPRGHRTRSPLLPRSWAEVAPRTHRARGRHLASLASRTRQPPCDVRYASPFGFFRCGRCADATVQWGSGLPRRHAGSIPRTTPRFNPLTASLACRARPPPCDVRYASSAVSRREGKTHTVLPECPAPHSRVKVERSPQF